MNPVDVLLKAPTAQQQKLIDAIEREQLYGGAKRGGKTVGGAQKSTLLSVVFPGNRGALFRKNLTDLKKSTLTTFFETCPSELILDHNKTDHIIRIRTAGKPSEILYSGLGDGSDVEKVKGWDLGWFWIDEPTEVEEEAFLMVRAQLNWKLPDGTRPPYMALLTSNPEPGWVKRRYIDNGVPPGAIFIPSLPRDNPHLPPGYEEELRATYGEDWVRKYLDGSWRVAEGSVFQELDENVHDLDLFTSRMGPSEYGKWLDGLRKVSAIDHATTGVSAEVQNGHDSSENAFALEEYYERNKLVSEHAASMKALMARYGRQDYTLIDPSTEAKTQVQSTDLFSVLDEYHRNGINASPAHRARIDIGINLVQELLHVNPLHRHPFTGQMGSPRLFISRKRCPNLWREMAELRREILASGQTHYLGDDHALDCERYILMSRPKPARMAERDVAGLPQQEKFIIKSHDSWGKKFDQQIKGKNTWY